MLRRADRGPGARQGVQDAPGRPSADTLTVTAKHYGDWGNGLNVAVIAGDAGGEFKLVITHDTDTSVSETSPSFATGALAAGWASQYVTVTDVPGRLSIRRSSRRSPSQAARTITRPRPTRRGRPPWRCSRATSAPGRCPRRAGRRRRDTPTCSRTPPRATVTRSWTARTPRRSPPTPPRPRSCARSRPPGRACSSRHGPSSRDRAGHVPHDPLFGVQAGVIARGQAQGLDEGEAFAGPLKGRSAFATGLSQAAWTDAQRGTLNDAGVLVARLDPVYGVLAYGNRTLSDPAAKPLEVEASAARVIMAIKARGDAVAQRYAFAQIDDRRLKLGEFAGDLDGEACRPYYDAGALYGETAGMPTSSTSARA